MTKLTKVLALALVVATLCLALASCGGLSGTYSNNGLFGLGATELEFSGSKVTIKVGDLEATGNYEIDDDKITITLDNIDDGSASWEDLLAGFSGTKSFEKGDDYIKIGGTKYTKD
ncbi:MAG: hypothetical protein IJW21_03395 [Clostridia bacterium]|nr:hypothetical protein [Clostridia bacterium]